jgi:hypothetical protein
MVNVSQKGRRLTNNSSEESKWLYNILQAIYNNGGIQTAIVAALGGGVTPPVITHYDLLSADTHTFNNTDEYKSISFQVITGGCSLQIDGGTTVDYPAGSNINLNGVPYLNSTFVFTVDGTASDGLNRTLIQVSQ